MHEHDEAKDVPAPPKEDGPPPKDDAPPAAV
jgi:hypothetical protein